MRWFERTFELGVPIFLFPSIVERLRGTPGRLDERVRRAGIVVAVTEGGRWSVLENAGHLGDLEPLWLGRVEDLLSGRDVLRDADLENRKTHEAGHNDADDVSILSAFRRDRSKLVDRLEELGEEDLKRTAKHPRLGQPMTLVDLCFFVAEHDDHHLARITEISRDYRLLS